MSQTAAESTTPANAERRLFVAVSGNNEFADRPAYAVIVITQELVAQLKKLQSVCKNNDLADVRVWDYSVSFGPMADGSDYRTDCDRLMVTGEDFSWCGYEKYSSDYWRTRPVSIEDAVRIADDRSGRTEWFGGYEQDEEWAEVEEAVREATAGAA